VRSSFLSAIIINVKWFHCLGFVQLLHVVDRFADDRESVRLAILVSETLCQCTIRPAGIECLRVGLLVTIVGYSSDVTQFASLGESYSRLARTTVALFVPFVGRFVLSGSTLLCALWDNVTQSSSKFKIV